ncbi:TetR/AcrR family transcriptional regulator [Isoptericola sp. BMS4]|uniref:TetR/AcrR family transcriptional regulator n=1 Tax=Isoptericola sp. BMS4 TaxID=2527875 RepID=UPI001424000C|nr:TetR/AcrR family transcriptional regulator [Isoptericola sp. BMS4]
MAALTTPRALRTRARILDAALDLFEHQGYDATTVTQVADAAGVTQMTFFRHFPTKDAVLVSDPYDPLIAEAVGAQPRGLPPFERVRRGMLAALATIGPVEDATARRRVALVARLQRDAPALRGAVVAATGATEDAIADRLAADGTPPLDARVAAAACLGAATAALLALPDDGRPLADAVTHALRLLGPPDDATTTGTTAAGRERS